MALNFTKSYTFTPSTTAASSQVNTNFDEIASVFQGLEAETKTLAKLKVDIDPTTALEVATKQYVDHLLAYRRPVLQYSSATVVNMETGINGTSGQAQILFPDGNLRTDSTAGRINCNLAQVAALSGTWQSGLRTGSVATNTWYAVYAVKTTDDTAKFVAVADTVLPIQANYATLNSNFGSSGWVYLGLVRNGDGSAGGQSGLLTFTMTGNRIVFRNQFTGQAQAGVPGLSLASTAGAATLTYTYSAGTAGAVIPTNITHARYTIDSNQTSGGIVVADSSGAQKWAIWVGTAANDILGFTPIVDATAGLKLTPSTGSPGQDIQLVEFYDAVLGVGSNPIL